MKLDRDDGEIRQLFQQLKEQDEQLAQPFRAHLETMRRRVGAARRGKPIYRLAAGALAALLLAGLTVAIWRQARSPRPRAEVSIAELSRWRAPTDSLLRTPGDQLLRAVPRFSAPLSGKSLFGGETR